MLRRLGGGNRSGVWPSPSRCPLAAASKHVKTLERAGLVRRTVKGRTHLCRLEPAPLAQADEWLRRYERYWTESLDALETILETMNDNEYGARSPPTPSASSGSFPAPSSGSGPT